jgi:hypothetical protein
VSSRQGDPLQRQGVSSRQGDPRQRQASASSREHRSRGLACAQCRALGLTQLRMLRPGLFFMLVLFLFLLVVDKCALLNLLGGGWRTARTTVSHLGTGPPQARAPGGWERVSPTLCSGNSSGSAGARGGHVTSLVPVGDGIYIGGLSGSSDTRQPLAGKRSSGSSGCGCSCARACACFAGCLGVWVLAAWLSGSQIVISSRSRATCATSCKQAHIGYSERDEPAPARAVRRLPVLYYSRHGGTVEARRTHPVSLANRDHPRSPPDILL